MSKSPKFTVITGMGKAERTYKINGATYSVSSRFQPLSKADCLKDRIKKLLEKGFAHLMNDSDDDKLKTENVCSAVGKEDNNAAEEKSA